MSEWIILKNARIRKSHITSYGRDASRTYINSFHQFTENFDTPGLAEEHLNFLDREIMEDHPKNINDLFFQPFDKFDLSSRTCNYLGEAGIYLVGDLAFNPNLIGGKSSFSKLYKIDNIGIISHEELVIFLTSNKVFDITKNEFYLEERRRITGKDYKYAKF